MERAQWPVGAIALSDVHMGVMRSVATAPGRDVTRNARLCDGVHYRNSEVANRIGEQIGALVSTAYRLPWRISPPLDGAPWVKDRLL
jgi:hypothetical protein